MSQEGYNYDITAFQFNFPLVWSEVFLESNMSLLLTSDWRFTLQMWIILQMSRLIEVRNRSIHTNVGPRYIYTNQFDFIWLYPQHSMAFCLIKSFPLLLFYQDWYYLKSYTFIKVLFNQKNWLKVNHDEIQNSKIYIKHFQTPPLFRYYTMLRSTLSTSRHRPCLDNVQC